MKNLYLFATALLMSLAGMAQTDMVVVSPFTDSIWTIDTTNLTQSVGIALTSTSGTVTGCNGMAKRPCTSDIYVIYKVDGAIGRFLGIVDPTTGVITEIGNTGDNVAGITFGSENHLYAVTGDGASASESLFKVNIATGAMTLFTALGNGDDGETIAFNPDDGKIYHWSGLGTQVMESIDTATGAVSNIAISGYNYQEAFGAKYIGNGEFYLTNIDSEILVMNTSGVASTPFFTATNDLRGMEFEANPGDICNQLMYTVSPYTDSIWTVDTTNFSQSTGIALTSSSGTVLGCTGLATHPCTGDLYVVYKISGVVGRFLGIVDPTTGVITEVGNMGDNVAGITFGSANHLYAVTGDGGTVSESLFKVNIATGAMTLFTALGSGSDGETIAFNPDDSKIYHWSGAGTQVMESIDTTSGAVTNIPISGFTSSPEYLGAKYIGNGQFMLSKRFTQDMIIMNTSGFGTLAGTSVEPYKGLEFPLNNPPVPVASAFTYTTNNLTATFTDASTGPVTDWFWDYGDGISSSTQNPFHTYFSPGSYVVCLTATGPCGSSSFCDTVVFSCPPVNTFFTHTGNNLSTSFTNASSGNLLSSLWDFGDGNTSGTFSPNHTYASAGTYLVCLTMTDSCAATSTFCDTVIVNCAPLSSSFTHTSTNLAASFTNTSSGNLLSSLWDFGDGNTSGTFSPNHTYASAGTYLVCLTMTDSCAATSTFCDTVTVTLPSPPNDSLCNAIALSFGPNGNGPFDVSGAGPQAGEPVPPIGSDINTAGCQSQDGWCDGGGFVSEPFIQNSVWFTFIAPPSGNVTVNTDGSYDTQIAVYSATSCNAILAGSYTLEGANDDNPNAVTTFSSELTVTCLVPGGTYWLQVDGYDGDEGPLNILLTDNLYLADATITASTDSICPGDTAILSAPAGAGFSYVWSNGTFSQSTSTPFPGSYNLTVLDSNGCVLSDTIIITQLNAPNVGLNPSGSAVYCTGDSVLLTGSNGGQSQWYLNGVAIAGATSNSYFASAEGIYNMTKTNQNGCSDSAAVGISVTEDPCITGIGGVPFAADLNLYPSPISNTLTVSFNNNSGQGIRVSLFANDGRLVYADSPSVGLGPVMLSIDMAQQVTGIYLLQIQQGETLVTRRVMKN